MFNIHSWYCRNSGNVKLTDKEVGTSRELFPKPSHFYRHYNTKNNITEQVCLYFYPTSFVNRRGKMAY